MTEGADRLDVPYVWPSTLIRPPRPPKLVYLDLNHWISLAKVVSGHVDGARFTDVLRACIEARKRGTAVFPISDTIYVEVSKIGQHRQRRDIREAIELVSGYAVVTGRPIVTAHEVEAVLDRLVGPSPDPVNTMDYLDWGVARAFGMVGGFRMRSRDGTDVTAEVRAAWKDGPRAFDELCATTEMDLQRQVLDGPAPDEEATMKAAGWNPRAAFEVAERRAIQEIQQVATFDQDPRWRRGRIRDVIAARELLIDVNETLYRGLSDRKTALSTLFASPDEARRAFDAMPSFDVAVTLKASYHRNAAHRWKPNDILDIDALGSTLPYCDVVVTDAAVAAHATKSGLAARLETTVLSRLGELPGHL